MLGFNKSRTRWHSTSEHATLYHVPSNCNKHKFVSSNLNKIKSAIDSDRNHHFKQILLFICLSLHVRYRQIKVSAIYPHEIYLQICPDCCMNTFHYVRKMSWNSTFLNGNRTNTYFYDNFTSNIIQIRDRLVQLSSLQLRDIEGKSVSYSPTGWKVDFVPFQKLYHVRLLLVKKKLKIGFRLWIACRAEGEFYN